MTERQRRRITAGIILITVGLILFAVQRLDQLGEAAVFFVVGGAFLAAYLYRKAYGLLIPAGILLGLGAGSVWGGRLAEIGEPHVLGLGLGFIAIYLIALAYERRSHWWPLVPGGILVLAAIPDTQRVVRYLAENWPLFLVLIGVLILVRGLATGERRGSGTA